MAVLRLTGINAARSSKEPLIDKVYFGIVGFLTRLHHLVSPPSADWKPLEKRLISEVMDGLPGGARELLRQQVDGFNLIQRDGQKQKSVFYRVENGVERYPQESLFPRRADDVKFAAITFTVPASEKPFHAGFWAHDGRMFQIAFDRSMRAVLGVEDVRVVQREVWPERLMGS